jgi:hypothetical protein
MRVSNRSFEGPVLGRYALHLHHGEDGTRGTMIRGVAAIESLGRVFVPHESHGVTLIDNVSVNSFAEALWWDKGDRSDNIVVDRLAVLGVHTPREISGRNSMFSGVLLMGGVDLVIRNSVVSGARGGKLSHGFDWPSQDGERNEVFSIWEFNEGNVAHNNEGSGVRFWFNRREPHVTAGFITYRHGVAGIENGAYINAHRFFDAFLFEDGIFQHSSSKAQSDDGGPARFERIRAIVTEGPALWVGHLRAFAEDDSATRTEFIDCDLQAGPDAPKVLIDGAGKTRNPFIALFRRCDVTPDDFDFGHWSSALEGTSVIIEHESGKTWEITLDVKNKRKIVREL